MSDDEYEEFERMKREVFEELAALDAQITPQYDRIAKAYGQQPVDQPTKRNDDAERIPFPLSDLGSVDDPIPETTWVWRNLIPNDEVTLLSGHGGAGKSFLALELAVAVAIGLPLFRHSTVRTEVLFFSAEDKLPVVKRRLRTIAQHWSVDWAELCQWLHVVDVSEEASTLYCEHEDSSKPGGHTTAYWRLMDTLSEHPCGLVIVDNASETYDGPENHRQHVRRFIGELKSLTNPRRAVLLLAHVNKNVAINGEKAANGENYSGSTQWHNSVRSRMTLFADNQKLKLQHEKSNYGPLVPEIELTRDLDGFIEVPTATELLAASIERANNMRTVLRLLMDEMELTPVSSTATTGQYSASSRLKRRPGMPNLQPKEVHSLLDAAKTAGYLIETPSMRSGGKSSTVWTITEKGREFVASNRPATA